jgi:TonB family protein
MPVTQIPPRDPSASPATPPSGSPPGPQDHRDLFEGQHWETAYRTFNPDDVPHLLIQLQDDLSRARKREAIWLSVILHLFIVILLWNSEKIAGFLPHRAVPIELRAATDREKDATFLELPPDQQKPTRRPDSKIVSDKDRIATSKTPQIDRDELRKLLQSTRPGQPGPTGQPTPPAPPQVAQNQAPPEQQPAPQPTQQPPSGFTQPQTNDQTAQLRVPQGRQVPNFNTPMTPGSAIEQAAQAAAANRGRYAHGDAGDYGFPGGRGGAKALDQAEILTDTMGVDFGPYLTRVVQVVKANWYNLMPPSVYPPILKQGKLSIEFVIQKDGKVSGMNLHTSSGDVPLDRAAWASITASNPFPPLPKEFPGQILGLRFYYFYNLQVDDLK